MCTAAGYLFRIVSRIELWNYVDSISLQSLFYLHICVLQQAICSELCHVLSYGIMLVPSLSNLYSIHIFGMLFQWFWTVLIRHQLLSTFWTIYTIYYYVPVSQSFCRATWRLDKELIMTYFKVKKVLTEIWEKLFRNSKKIQINCRIILIINFCSAFVVSV